MMKSRLSNTKRIDMNISLVIPGAKAFRFAMEDPKTIYFIMTNFSSPEKHPDILTHKTLIKDGEEYTWRIEVIEKKSSVIFSNNQVEWLNVALIEVNGLNGEITNRLFYRNIFFNEYKHIVGSLK